MFRLPKSLVFTLFFTITCMAANAQEADNQAIVRNALAETEKVGVMIGMSEQEVLNILGKNYQQEKINDQLSNDKVYTWYRDKETRLSVTFSGDKVKAISHQINAKQKE